MAAAVSTILVVVTLWIGAYGRPEYQDKIPNGHNVPNPCPEGGKWEGVGHESKSGGGDRNNFGKEFFNNGKKWDVVLCHKDSDNDGRTNGMELGDPRCEWTEGGTPASTQNITHPGICEPVTTPSCRQINSFLQMNCLPTTLGSTTEFTTPSGFSAQSTTPYVPGAFSTPTFPEGSTTALGGSGAGATESSGCVKSSALATFVMILLGVSLFISLLR